MKKLYIIILAGDCETMVIIRKSSQGIADMPGKLYNDEV